MIAAALTRLRACPESRKWVARRRSPAKAWAECPRGPWLAWVLVRAARTDAERREALGVVCAVVREIAPPRDPVSERALSLAEAWCHGEPVPRNDLSAVARAADAAWAAAAADAAADAAWAAAAAADAAGAAAYAAAAYSSTGAAAANYAAADAIRRRLPTPPAWVLAACEVRQ